MKKALAKFLFKDVSGWKMEGEFPKHIKKGIIIPGPHTSNWDFFYGVLVRAFDGFQSNFVIKDSWLKKPIIGSVIKAMGGVVLIVQKIPD